MEHINDSVSAACHGLCDVVATGVFVIVLKLKHNTYSPHSEVWEAGKHKTSYLTVIPLLLYSSTL